MADKARVTLASIQVAATQGVVWGFTTGVQPYQTVMVAHERQWDRLKGRIGQAVELKFVDSRERSVQIKDVYILHEVPSDAKNRRAFVVSDKRWKWPYKILVRDFNMPRKTGDRTAFGEVPETQEVIDEYDYLAYSLNEGKRWTARDAVEHLLEVVEPDNVEIDGWPIQSEGSGGSGSGSSGSGSSDGEFTLQGVELRDPADIAIARMLSYVPGADVWVDADGKIRVFDQTDLAKAEEKLSSLPALQRVGDFPRYIDRAAVRPEKVIVHYTREIEVMFEFDDDYSGSTVVGLQRDIPYVENVLPTVDTETEVEEFDPESGETKTKTVPPGTWVSVEKWLEAMDNDRPEGSLPWTFEVIRRHWLAGDLDGVLGARGLDNDPDGNVPMRVAALKQHFRQTFRINRRYMSRLRSLRAVRVGLLDPVTGARAPAAVWGQACVIPSKKGHRMARRGPEGPYGVYRNVDYVPQSGNVVEGPPGPTRVSVLDEELGIFRLEWIQSPYGDVESFVPCNLHNNDNQPKVITRDLAKQDEEPVGAGIQIEGGANGIFLSHTSKYRVLLTVVPNSPGNKQQFHRETIEPDQISSTFRSEFRIKDGEGPELEVYVPPGEATARFAWKEDNVARSTLKDLLGLVQDDPNTQEVEGSVPGPDLPGWEFVNRERELKNHAVSLAAEQLAAYADGVQGSPVTVIPRQGDVELVGNMNAAHIRIGSAPSAKLDVAWRFPGQQRPISRFALLSREARSIVLGTLPYKE